MSKEKTKIEVALVYALLQGHPGSSMKVPSFESGVQGRDTETVFTKEIVTSIVTEPTIPSHGRQGSVN